MKAKFHRSLIFTSTLACSALALNCNQLHGQTLSGGALNIGANNSVAASSKSVAVGDYNTADSSGLAIGSGNVAYAGSMCLGLSNFSNYDASSNFLQGEGNIAEGYSSYSSLFGLGNNATNANYSMLAGSSNGIIMTSNQTTYANVLMGSSNYISGLDANSDSDIQNSILLGVNNITLKTRSWTFGNGLIGSTDSLAVGTYNAANSNAVFIVGNGTSNTDRKNSLEVARNGMVAFGGDIKLATDTSGIYFGSNTTATLKAGTGGAAIFPSSATFSNGITLSSGTLSIASTTASTSSATGALTVAGGIGVALDSWFNGVRIGKGAGNVATNTTLGNLALNSNTSGTQNTAVGANALKGNLTGGGNTAVGNAALQSNTSGGNTAVGDNSMFAMTIGHSNTAIGQNSIQYSTGGYYNVAVGQFTLGQLSSGYANTALGNNAGRHNTTGAANLFLGFDAGRYFGSNINDTTPITLAYNSIFIGKNSRSLADNVSNSIVIGTNAVGDGNNTTVIGNISTIKTSLFGNLNLKNRNITGPTGSLQYNGADLVLASTLSNYATTASLSNYATTASLSSYVSTASVNTLVDNRIAVSLANSVSMSGGTTSANNATAVSYGEAGGFASFAASGGFALGDNSTALSYGQAYGINSFAAVGGYAVGEASIALGDTATSNGASAFASTYGVANGDGSTAMGNGIANGNSSISMGMNAIAEGIFSIALVSGSTDSTATYSLASSGGSTSGAYSTAIGMGAVSPSYSSASFGSFCLSQSNQSVNTHIETDVVLSIGNGSSNSTRSNAITTLKNGETTLTNKAWKNRDVATVSATADPSTEPTDSNGNALVVEGHTILKGKVIIEQAQGDISMGNYQ